MHIAGETIKDNQTCEVDVCVVGAGPTGIAAALSLCQKGVSVCLLESGASEKEAKTVRDQDRGLLPQGSRYYPLDIIRFRAVGGSATAWDAHVAPYNQGARYIPFDEVDFEHRSQIPGSGWPISRSDLDPYYEKAQAVAQIGPYDYNLGRWSEQTSPFDLDESLLRSGVFQYGSAHVYYDVHRRTLEAKKNVQLYTSTTVVELIPSLDGTSITHLVARARGGGEVSVRAGATLLCMGAIENSRLLLVSRKENPAGIGNQNGMVGKYFVDHPLVTGGSIIPKDLGFFFDSHFYDWREVSGTTVCGHIKLSAEVMRQEEVLGVGSMLIPRSDHTGLPGVQAARGVLDALKSKRPPPWSALKGSSAVLLEIPSILERRKAERLGVDLPINRGGWSRSQEVAELVRTFDVVWATEQTALPQHRIELVDEVDSLGIPRVMAHWNWTDFDQACIKRSQEVFVEAFKAFGLARFEPKRVDGQLVMRAPTMHHPMGGTRMNDDPEGGVVDRKCKVHGVENLFIAGGSVFPTGSFANPTLTMMATGILAAESASSVVSSKT